MKMKTEGFQTFPQASLCRKHMISFVYSLKAPNVTGAFLGLVTQSERFLSENSYIGYNRAIEYEDLEYKGD